MGNWFKFVLGATQCAVRRSMGLLIGIQGGGHPVNHFILEIEDISSLMSPFRHNQAQVQHVCSEIWVTKEKIWAIPVNNNSTLIKVSIDLLLETIRKRGPTPMKHN